MGEGRPTPWALVLMLATAGSACLEASTGEDADPPLDAALRDSAMDVTLDSATPPPVDAAMASPCRSWTDPTANTCGGTHCLQSFEQLRASVLEGAACGSLADLETLCSLKGPDTLASCSLTHATDRPRIPECARAALKDTVTEACLDCYVKSTNCAFDKCLFECLAGTETDRCDTCRLNAGCGDVFYECAGIMVPPR